MKTLYKTLATCCILASAISFADNAIADRDTKNLIGGYGASNAGLNALVRRPNDGPLIIAQDNSQLLYVPFPTNPLTIEQTLQGLFQYFVPIPQPKPDQQLQNNLLTFGPPGTPPPAQRNYFKPGPQPQEDDQKQKQRAPFANIDVNSLLGPLVYKDEQKKSAENFINAATGIGTPLNIVDLVDLGSKKTPPVDAATLANTPNTDVARYLAALRTYGAMQAVGLSNLYQFYAERLPSKVDESDNKILATALKGINMPNASQLQVENYMATRRLTDPQWVASLSNDSPSSLLRQIAVLLAENLAESYNIHMATERLTVTMTMLELQQASNTRALIEQQVNSLSSTDTNNKAPPTPGTIPGVPR